MIMSWAMKRVVLLMLFLPVVSFSSVIPDPLSVNCNIFSPPLWCPTWPAYSFAIQFRNGEIAAFDTGSLPVESVVYQGSEYRNHYLLLGFGFDSCIPSDWSCYPSPTLGIYNFINGSYYPDVIDHIMVTVTGSTGGIVDTADGVYSVWWDRVSQPVEAIGTKFIYYKLNGSLWYEHQALCLHSSGSLSWADNIAGNLQCYFENPDYLLQSVSGRVLDSLGNAVAGFQVNLSSGKIVNTDLAGNYVFYQVDPGVYDILVSSSNLYNVLPLSINVLKVLDVPLINNDFIVYYKMFGSNVSGGRNEHSIFKQFLYNHVGRGFYEKSN